jgi:hypothetical protein
MRFGFQAPIGRVAVFKRGAAALPALPRAPAPASQAAPSAKPPPLLPPMLPMSQPIDLDGGYSLC